MISDKEGNALDTLEVKAEVPVLLPYDRDLSLKDTDEFIELRRKVNQLIEHESLS